MQPGQPVIAPEEISAFCNRHHIRKLSLFGSILTDRFGPDSDVDVLVEFEPEHVPGYFRLIGMEMELSDLVGRKVDLRTPGELGSRIREQIVRGAAIQFERQ